MKRNHYPIIFLAALIAVGLTACNVSASEQGTGNGNEPSAGPQIPVSGSCANPLMPVIQNATWTYASTGSPAGPYIYTDTITGIRADGFTLTSKFHDAMRVEQWACLRDGLQSLQFGSGNAAGLSAQNLTAGFTTSDVTGLTLPADVQQDAQWAYGLKMKGMVAMPGDQNAQSGGALAMTMRALGYESVTVPAGRFQAVKIEANSAFNLTSTFQGVNLPIKINETTIMWYAPGVGWVKSVENGELGGTAFTATTELQSYKIPK